MAGRSWVRRLVIGTSVVVGLVLVFHLVGGWYFANVLRDDALDAENRRAELAPDYTVDLLAVEDGRVTLDPADSSLVSRTGVWGIAWPSGYGIVREVVEDSPDRVTRVFELVDGSLPEPGTKVDVQERAFPDDPEAMLGRSPEVVQVPGPLGDHESWFFPGTRRTWALLLHGNTPNRLDMARLLPALQAEGYPALLVSLRNDPGAPEDPSGLLRYGATEWEDLEAAVRYATGNGADGVVLVGPSMGGGVAMSFLERSPSADEVRAVVLDAPMLDFSRTVDFQAGQESLPVVGLPLPGTLTASAKWLASVRFDVDWDELDYLASTEGLAAPILVFHGSEDDDIPLATSRDLVAERPDLVTLHEVEGATHMTTWNTDPVTYERLVVDFLRTNAP